MGESLASKLSSKSLEGNSTTRRDFLKLTLGASGQLLLAACVDKALAAPTPASTSTTEAAGGGTAPRIAAATPIAAKSAPTNVKIGYFSTIAHVAPVFIGKALGYYEEQGINLEPVEFGTSNLAIPAIVTGDLQAIIGLSVGAAVYNALNAQPGVMKLVAACITASTDDIIGTFVRKDLYDKGAKTPADLKGRTVYMPARGGVVEYSLAVALKKYGLTIKDVKILNLPGYSEIYQGLQAKTVDFGVLGEPYASQAKDKGIGLPVAPYGQYIPGVQLTYLALGKKLLTEQRDVAVRMMRAYLKTVMYYEQARKKGPNRQDAVKYMLAGLKGATAQAIEDSIWYYLQPDGKIEVNSLEAQAKYYADQGFIKPLLPSDQVIDTTILADANK